MRAIIITPIEPQKTNDSKKVTTMPDFKTFATFVTNDTLRNLFQKGHLVEEWSSMYTMLFDKDDKRIALSQAENNKAHYHEWLAAIILYHTKGLLSLNQKYAYPSHTHKRELLEKLTIGKAKAFKFITDRALESITQLPDLLVYKKDYKSWFFAEVKGPRDKLRPSQIQLFKELQQITGKKVVIVEFQTF
jgi:hypothetical protein